MVCISVVYNAKSKRTTKEKNLPTFKKEKKKRLKKDYLVNKPPNKFYAICKSRYSPEVKLILKIIKINSSEKIIEITPGD
jgi:hypothetical protein